VSRRANIVRHGANHAPGGSDPIAGLGGGGAKTLLACWGGALPIATRTGIVWRVPFAGDGSSLSFTITEAFARLEVPRPTAVSFRLEKSAGGEAVFTASTITTLTVVAGDYEQDTTGLAVAVDSGDLVRVVYTAVATISTGYQVELTGQEA
jgi:hypothetical protein